MRRFFVGLGSVVILAAAAATTMADDNHYMRIYNQGSTVNHSIVIDPSMPLAANRQFGIDIRVTSSPQKLMQSEANLVCTNNTVAEIKSFGYANPPWSSSSADYTNPITPGGAQTWPDPKRIPLASELNSSQSNPKYYMRAHGRFGTLANDVVNGLTASNTLLVTMGLEVPQNAPVGTWTLSLARFNVGALPDYSDIGTLFSTDLSFDLILENHVAKASTPSPSNLESNVDLDADLSWVGATGAYTYDVWFGPEADQLSLVSAGQAGTAWALSTLDPDEDYFWRIDSYSEHGLMTTGDVWEFTTMPEPASLVLLTLGFGLLGRRRRTA